MATLVNLFRNRAKMVYDQRVSGGRATRPYAELQWTREDGTVTGQVLVHEYSMDPPDPSGMPPYHGHMSFYVWDRSDPSGQNRHHPLNIYFGTRDPQDPVTEKRNRSRVTFDHAYVDLMDSRLVMKSPSGKAWELLVSDTGILSTRPAVAMPVPRVEDIG